MRELRRDPVVNRWVIIDRSRREREGLLERPEAAGVPPGPCPFCPGNEDKEYEIFGLGPPGRLAGDKRWSVRVIPDKYPLLRVEGELDRRGEGMYDLMNAVGAHELVVETPEHGRTWPELPDAQIEQVLFTYRERSLDLRKDQRFRTVMMVKNHGLAVSIFQHSHSHIIALPVVPRGIEEEIQGVNYYYTLKERCVYCDVVKEEINNKKRVVVETTHFLACAPFASRFPFELMLMPRRHYSDFGHIEDEEIKELAQVFKEVLTLLGLCFPNLSSSIIMHTGPLHEYAQDAYHWHIEILPKLLKVAGFEWGTGFFSNPVPPEEAAALLRGEGQG